MERGSLVVARGGTIGYVDGYNRWQAKLYPHASDWGAAKPITDGTLGLVVKKLGRRSSGRELMLVVIDLHTQGWMCEGDGWELA